MGRPRKNRQPEPENEPETIPIEPESNDQPENSADLEKIDQILRDNDLTGGLVMIFRQGRHDLEPFFLASIPTDSFTVEDVVQRFGGGRYQFRFKDGRGKMAAFARFSADHRLKGQIDDTPPAPAPPPPPPVTDSKDMMTLLMSMLAQAQGAQQKSSETLIAVVTAAMSRPEPQRVDPWASIGPVLTAISPLVSKAMEQKGPIGSIKEVLDLMKHAKSIGGGDEREGDGFSGIISAVGSLLAQRAQAQQPAPMIETNGQPAFAGAAPVTMLPDAAASGLPTAPATSPNMTIEGKILFYGKMQLGKLSRAAQRGVDPVSYADVLLNELDDLDPAYAYALIDALKAPDWMVRIFGQTAVPFQPWFDQLREALLEEPTEEENKVTEKAAK